jgi:hypothetical protein
MVTVLSSLATGNLRCLPTWLDRLSTQPFGSSFLIVQIAINGVRAYSHRTRMQRMLGDRRRDFAVREVSPAFRLTEPFPTVFTIQCSAPLAESLVCRCDHFASVLRSIEEATAALTFGCVRLATSLDAKASTVWHGLSGRRLSTYKNRRRDGKLCWPSLADERSFQR